MTLRPLLALALALLASLPGPASGQIRERPRTVVLRFEGWRAEQAREAVVAALQTDYELLDEGTLIDTAARIAADVATPEGMATVVAHLGVALVVGGFVEGRARSSTTTVWVMDVHGNELARRTTSGPTGRPAAGDIEAAAAEVVGEAYARLRAPAASSAPETEPVPRERAAEPEPEPEPVDVSGRWNMPYVRALAGIRIRNRTASVAPDTHLDRFDADFFPDIQLMVEVRPLARAVGPERGLYFAISGGFSAGLGYFRRPPNDTAPVSMQVYNFEIDAGYGLVLADLVELVFSLGFGIDGMDLAEPTAIDFPSSLYSMLRPAVQGRFRLVPDSLLLAELGFGGRINFDSGSVGPSYGLDGSSSGGIDLYLGLAGAIDGIGFSWAARFGYVAYFLGFSGGRYTSGTDEAVQFWLLVGWSF